MAREVAAAAEVGARQAAEIPAVAFLVALGDPIAARVVGDAESAPVAVDRAGSGAEIAARGEHRVELTAEQRAVGRGLRDSGAKWTPSHCSPSSSTPFPHRAGPGAMAQVEKSSRQSGVHASVPVRPSPSHVVAPRSVPSQSSHPSRTPLPHVFVVVPSSRAVGL